MKWPRAPEPDVARAWREAERQVEWAETYLAAVDGIDLHDFEITVEVRRLRSELAELRRRLARPRVL